MSRESIIRVAGLLQRMVRLSFALIRLLASFPFLPFADYICLHFLEPVCRVTNLGGPVKVLLFDSRLLLFVQRLDLGIQFLQVLPN
jgi:hypothetical protein